MIITYLITILITNIDIMYIMFRMLSFLIIYCYVLYRYICIFLRRF